jgi:hypothetical protein
MTTARKRYEQKGIFTLACRDGFSQQLPAATVELVYA